MMTKESFHNWFVLWRTRSFRTIISWRWFSIKRTSHCFYIKRSHKFLRQSYVSEKKIRSNWWKMSCVRRMRISMKILMRISMRILMKISMKILMRCMKIKNEKMLNLKVYRSTECLCWAFVITLQDSFSWR